MAAYAGFFLNSSPNVVQLETLEISHPNFSKVYRVVRNAINGLVATLEDGVTIVNFDYQPMKIVPTKSNDDLDQSFNIQLGDLGQILPQELDNVNNAGGFLIKPKIIYRTYRSDDLAHVLNGPLNFELANLAFKKEGCTFDAQAPRLNVSSTGEIYTIDRFPMLKGFL